MAFGIDTRVDWRWLAGTYWYVAAPDLPALQLAGDGRTLEWVSDQTVWQIIGYQNGYFWGTTAVQIREDDDGASRREPRVTHLTLLGTVTPSGQVQITFAPGGRSPIEATLGHGQMVKEGPFWRFEMQMSTDRLRRRVLHWATMVQTHPGEASWERLPGTELSVPAMLEGAEPPRFADGSE